MLAVESHGGSDDAFTDARDLGLSDHHRWNREFPRRMVCPFVSDLIHRPVD